MHTIYLKISYCKSNEAVAEASVFTIATLATLATVWELLLAALLISLLNTT